MSYNSKEMKASSFFTEFPSCFKIFVYIIQKLNVNSDGIPYLSYATFKLII